MGSDFGSTPFDIGGLLNNSWEVFKENVGPLVGAVVLILVVLLVGNSCTMGLASLALAGPFALGFTAMCLACVRRQPVEFNILFSGFQRFLPAFMANLLITVFTIIGLVFCIIPGIAVGMFYMLTFYYMYDKNLDFWPAMEASRQTIMRDWSKWLILFLVLGGINMVGALVCLVGLLVSSPVTVLMLTLAYEQVEHAPSSVPPFDQ